MEDQVVNELLASIPKGEELSNPRAGDYENALLGEVVKSDDGTAMFLKFPGLTDKEGQIFEHSLYVGFPSRTDEKWKQRQFLSLLHDLGALPHTDNDARYVETPELADITVQSLQRYVGTSYNIRLKENKKSGFLNLIFLKQKKVQ